MKIQPKYMEEDTFIKKQETAMDVVDASAEVNCGKEDKEMEKSTKMDDSEAEDEMSCVREVVEGSQERMNSALMSRMLEVSCQKDKEVGAMESSVFWLQEELGKEEDKRRFLEAEVAELTQRLESAKDRCIKLEAEREKALLINSELDHKLKCVEQLHQKSLELSMKLEEAEAGKVQVGNQAEDLSVRICELESELSQSELRCAEHDAIHERNLELEDLVRSLGDLVLMLQKARDDDIAEARSNEYSGIRGDMMQQMSCRVQELESALSRFQAQQETGAECNQELEELVRELEILLESEKSRINDLEQKCGQAEEKSVRYAYMWCSATTELDAAVQKSMGLEDELNFIKSIYVDADRKLKQQSLEVENIREETVCQVEQLKATIFELESALSQSLLLRSQLEAELETVNERCGEQEGRANVAQERILQLKDLVRFWEPRVGESERRESEVEVVLMDTPTQENRISDVEQRFADMVSALTTEVENALEVVADNEKLLAESLEAITEQRRNLEEAVPPDTMVRLEVANLAHQYQELMEFLKKKESEVNSLYEQQQLLVQDHQIECYEKQEAETQTCTEWQQVKELSDMCSSLEEAVPPDTMVRPEVANLTHQYQELMEILKRKESEVNSLYEQQQLLVQEHQIECYEKQAAETQSCTEWQHVKELSDMCSSLEEAVPPDTMVRLEVANLAHQYQELIEILKRKESEMNSLYEQQQLLVQDHQIECYEKQAAEMQTCMKWQQVKELGDMCSNLEEAVPPDTMVRLEVANLTHQYQELMEILKQKESEVNSLYEQQQLLVQDHQMECYEQQQQQQLLVQDHQMECYEKQAAETQTCTEWQQVKELSDMCSNLEEQAKIHEINECELLEATGAQLLELEAKLGHLEAQTVDEKMSLEFRLNDLQQKLCAAIADKETAAEDLKQELSSETQSFQTMAVLFMEEKQLLHEASRAAQIELQTVKTELGRVLKEYEESNGNLRAELENLKLQAAQNSILLQTRVKELEHLLLAAGVMFEKQAENVLESPEKVQQRPEEELASANTELGQCQGELKKSNEMKRKKKKKAEKSSPEGPQKNIRVAVGVGLVSIVAAILAGKK